MEKIFREDYSSPLSIEPFLKIDRLVSLRSLHHPPPFPDISCTHNVSTTTQQPSVIPQEN